MKPDAEMQQQPEEGSVSVDQERQDRALQTLDAVRSALRHTDAAIGDLEVDGAFSAEPSVSEAGETVAAFAPLMALRDAYSGLEAFLELIEVAIARAAGPVPRIPSTSAGESDLREARQ